MSDAPILTAMQHVVDLDSADDFSRKHTPHISISANDDTVTISVAVGHYVAHPNLPDHFIQWIEIQVGGNTIARFDLSPVATSPVVSVVANLDPGTVVRAVEYCNLHGLWAAEATV